MKRSLSFLILIFAAYTTFSQINRPVGVNLSGIEDWSEEYVFVDVFKQSRDWIAHENRGGAPWSSGVTIPLRTDGYPLEIPYDNGVDPTQSIRTLMYFGNLEGKYPGGNYRLMASGTGQIRLWGAASGTFRCPVDTLVYVDSTRGGIGLEIDTSLVTDPVHDIRFVMPGFHNTFESQLFHPELIKFVEDFQVIRFMDWMKTNNSPVSTWENRNHTDHFTQTSSNGVAYEYIVKLCNRTYSNPWICIPHQADSIYIVNMARLLRDSLDPCLKVYVEYSNEVWNGIFAQNQYAAAQGDSLGYSGQPWERSWKYTAKRSADIFQIFENEFNNHDRFVKVIPAWAANDWVTNYIVDRFKEPLYNPSGVTADAVAIAPYYAGGIADRIGAAGQMASITVANLLDSMEYYLPRAYGWMDDCKTIADNHGLDLVAYEGGQHLVSYQPYHNDTAFVRKLLDANRHPRMQAMYCEYFEHWYDSTGADLFCAFSSHGGYSKHGAWGMKETYEDTLAPKYLGMRNCVFSQNHIDPPLAAADTDTVREGGSACFGVLGNDVEPNGDTMMLTNFTRLPVAGTATINGDSICYTAIGGFVGFDTLVYQICDGGCPGLCSEAQLIIEVKQSGSPLGVFDRESENEALDFKLFPNPSKGSFSITHTFSNTPELQGFDLLGREVKLHVSTTSTGFEVGVPQFRGLLLISLSDGQNMRVARVLVE